MKREVLVVREFEHDQRFEVGEVLKTLHGTIVEGQVLEIGAALKHFLDVGSEVFDFDAVKAQLFYHRGFSGSLDSFPDFVLSPFGHQS